MLKLKKHLVRNSVYKAITKSEWGNNKERMEVHVVLVIYYRFYFVILYDFIYYYLVTQDIYMLESY